MLRRGTLAGATMRPMATGPELAGARVRLVPCLPEHHPRLRELIATPGVRRWWPDPGPGWPEEDPDSVHYTVLVDGEIVGFVQWEAEKDPEFRHASLDLFLDPAVHGRGLGTEVVQVLCAHLVDDHGHHRLIIDPELDNEVAIATYRKVGFRPVGVMRKYMRRASGEYSDGLLMDLLAEELVRPS
jgi:aminoglycoside 6'-N-acetyltransferase